MQKDSEKILDLFLFPFWSIEVILAYNNSNNNKGQTLQNYNNPERAGILISDKIWLGSKSAKCLEKYFLWGKGRRVGNILSVPNSEAPNFNQNVFCPKEVPNALSYLSPTLM